MRSIYKRLPVEDQEVKRELRRLSRELGVPEPGLVMWHRGDGKYEHDEQTIYLPCVDWIKTYDPHAVGMDYWLTTIHELAHHIGHVKYEGNDCWQHSSEFYSILIGLALYLDLPLDVFYHDENGYLPGWFRKGRRLAGKKLLGDK